MSVADEPTESGRRVVYWLFGMALAIGVGFGYFIGVAISNDADVVGFLGVTITPTPLAMATYGGVAVCLGAAVFAGLQRFVASADDDGA